MIGPTDLHPSPAPHFKTFQLFYFRKCPHFSVTFGKSSNTKFHENPSSGSRVVPCGHRQTARHTNGWTDERTEKIGMTTLAVAFRNFANVPQKQHTAIIFLPGIHQYVLLLKAQSVHVLCETGTTFSTGSVI
jgi:hypothetical protein